MDCENFDRVVLDWVYGELGEIDAAATQRHLAHCTRCRRIASQLKASREVGLVPLRPIDDTLVPKVLEAENLAHAGLPLRQRFARYVSIVAGWSMRPQFAMGALLLLMIGASLVFLRDRRGDREGIGVLERGAAELHEDHGPTTPLLIPEPLPEYRHARGAVEPPAPAPPTASAPSAQARDDDPGTDAGPLQLDEAEAKARFDEAMSQFRNEDFKLAQKGFEALADSNTSVAFHAALLAARAVEEHLGCGSAIPRYENLAETLGNSALRSEAVWLGAECERRLRRWGAARAKYEALRQLPAYGSRADQALQALSRAVEAASDGGAADGAVPTPPLEEAAAPR